MLIKTLCEKGDKVTVKATGKVGVVHNVLVRADCADTKVVNHVHFEPGGYGSYLDIEISLVLPPAELLKRAEGWVDEMRKRGARSIILGLDMRGSEDSADVQVGRIDIDSPDTPQAVAKQLEEIYTIRGARRPVNYKSEEYPYDR